VEASSTTEISTSLLLTLWQFFYHETSQEELRRELQAMHHDSERLIEHLMTLFRQSFEPNVNIENITLSSAVDRIKQMWTFEQREWSIQMLYEYFEATF
jgi:hypothetical protein